MLHRDVVMKVTNEKKGIVSFYSNNMSEQKISMKAISITMDLMLRNYVIFLRSWKKHGKSNYQND